MMNRMVLGLSSILFLSLLILPAAQAQITDTEPAQILAGHTDWVSSLDYSPDGTRLVSVSRDGTAVMWNLSDGSIAYTINVEPFWFNAVAFNPNGQEFITGISNADVKAYDADTGTEIRTYTGHGGSVTSLAYSPDGLQFISGSEDNTAKIWNSSTGEVLQTLSGHGQQVVAVDFSPGGTKVATGSNDNTAKVWNAQTGAEIATMTGHTDWINGVAFTSDSLQLATVSFDTTVRLWDAATGSQIRTFDGHTDWIYAVDMSPVESKMVTASWDFTARIWNPSSGELLRILESPLKVFNSAVFSPDGQSVATGNEEGIVWIWSINREIPPTPTPTQTPTLAPTATSTPTLTPTLTPVGPTPTPRPDGLVLTHANAIGVYDDAQGFTDLTGDTDFDAADDRQLIVTWNIDDPNVTDWHVYAQVDIYGYFYLGRTGSGSVQRLEWPGSQFLSNTKTSGPAFGKTYRFRAVGLLGQPGYTIGTQSKPVAYTLEGSTASPVFSVPPATLEPGTLLITDDMFDTADLSGQTDTDDATQKAIFLRWNAGTNDYWNYHVYCSVNGGDALFLGQTGSGDVNYFRWSDITLFDTTDAFIDGPQAGNSYQFTIFALKGQGADRLDASGPLTYQVQ